MFTEMLHKLREKESDERTQKIQRYAELLKKGDAVSAEETGEVLALAAALGKSSDQVEADLRAIHERERLVKLIGEAPAREETYKKSARARNSFADEVERTIKELQAKLEELNRVSHRDEIAFHTAQRARNPLDELNRKHWELFGLSEPTGPIPFGPGNPYGPRTA